MTARAPGNGAGKELIDVIRVIHRLLTLLLERCLPAPGGRHRAGEPPQPVVPDPPTSSARRVHRRPHTAPLDGEATALVRPYLVAHEQRQRRHGGEPEQPCAAQWLRQRRARRALYLANRGIYVSPRVVRHHPVPGAAAAHVPEALAPLTPPNPLPQPPPGPLLEPPPGPPLGPPLEPLSEPPLVGAGRG